jgi:hypothetical protein
MFHRTLTLLSLIAEMGGAHVQAQTPSYPPFRDYAMPRDAELALARTAAPPTITDHATLKILTQKGFEVAHEGSNGFTCVVMRGWSAPTYTPNQFPRLHL